MTVPDDIEPLTSPLFCPTSPGHDAAENAAVDEPPLIVTSINFSGAGVVGHQCPDELTVGRRVDSEIAEREIFDRALVGSEPPWPVDGQIADGVGPAPVEFTAERERERREIRRRQKGPCRARSPPGLGLPQRSTTFCRSVSYSPA